VGRGARARSLPRRRLALRQFDNISHSPHYFIGPFLRFGPRRTFRCEGGGGAFGSAVRRGVGGVVTSARGSVMRRGGR
jgi:hypothetical protein